MAAVEHQRGEYCISTDQARLDVPFVHRFLSQSTYWAKQRPLTVVEKSIVHYGDTTLTFLTNLQAADDAGRGLTYVSAVAVELLILVILMGR